MGNIFLLKKTTENPIKKEPTRFTKIVEIGKLQFMILGVIIYNEYLKTLPIAPDKATSK